MSFEQPRSVYDRHVGRYSSRLASALIERAGVRGGDRVLDVGAGPGPLAEALATRLGAANVAAVEPSRTFADACRARVPGADVRIGTAEALPFENGRFDVALSQLVVNFMREPAAGAREMGRVARRTVASCVWDYAGEMWMLRHFWDGALDVDPDAPDEGRTMAHCSPDGLAALWRTAGLRDVETDELVVDALYADFDDYWSPFPQGVGPSGAYVAALDADVRERVRRAIYRRLGEPVGAFTLTARAWFVSGSPNA